MNDEATPAWEYLPNNPQAFFGLPVGFDRTTLREAYVRLLRRYKPERYPTEFQRIREAYEMLALRVSRQHKTASESGLDLRTPKPEVPSLFRPTEAAPRQTATDSPLESAPAVDPPKPPRSRSAELRQQIEDTSPADVYAGLRSASNRQPDDFIALAFLSDVIEPGRNGVFGYWLIQGLAAYPQSSTLLLLLREYCSQLTCPDEIGEILRFAEEIPAIDFPREWTEPLWLRLAKRATADQLPELWNRRRRVAEWANSVSQSAGDLDFLEQVIWTAPTDWLTARLDESDRRAGFGQDLLETRREFLRGLIEYRDECRLSLEPLVNPLIRSMDSTLRRYTSLAPWSCAGEYLAIQQELLLAPDQVQIAFPFPCPDPLPALARSWNLLGCLLEPLLLTRSHQRRPDREERAALRMLFDQLEKVTTRSLTGIRRLIGDLGQLLLMGIGYLVLWCSLWMPRMMAGVDRKNAENRGLGWMILDIAWPWIAGLALLAVDLRFVRKLRQRLSQARRINCYRRIWRRRLIDFVADSTWTLEEIRAVWMEERHILFSVRLPIYQLTASDPLLVLVSQAASRRV